MELLPLQPDANPQLDSARADAVTVAEVADHPISSEDSNPVLAASEPEIPTAIEETAAHKTPSCTESAPLQLLGTEIRELRAAWGDHAAKMEEIHKLLSGRTGILSTLATLSQSVESRNGVNRSMFEALHAEMQTYKESFLFETVYRPIVKDLIMLYDDTAEIHRQTAATLADQERRGVQSGAGLMLVEMVRQIIQHVEHHSEFIVELLDRLDVSMIADSKGCKLDKRSQRAITVEETTNPEEDQKVEKVLKRGFQYRGLIIRPEEVVIKRFKPSATAPASGTTPAPDIAGVVRR